MAVSKIPNTNKIGFIDIVHWDALIVGTPVTVSNNRWLYVHLFVPARSTFTIRINDATVFEYYSLEQANAEAFLPIMKGQRVTASCPEKEGEYCGRLYGML